MKKLGEWRTGKETEAQIAEGQDCLSQTVADLQDFLHFLQCSD